MNRKLHTSIKCTAAATLLLLLNSTTAFLAFFLNTLCITAFLEKAEIGEECKNCSTFFPRKERGNKYIRDLPTVSCIQDHSKQQAADAVYVIEI